MVFYCESANNFYAFSWTISVHKYFLEPWQQTSFGSSDIKQVIYRTFTTVKSQENYYTFVTKQIRNRNKKKEASQDVILCLLVRWSGDASPHITLPACKDGEWIMEEYEVERHSKCDTVGPVMY